MRRIRERRDGVLAFAANAEEFAACRKYRELMRAFDEFCETGSGGRKVLEVVEEQEGMLALKVPRKIAMGTDMGFPGSSLARDSAATLSMPGRPGAIATAYSR